MDDARAGVIDAFVVAPPTLLRWGLERLIETCRPGMRLLGAAGSLAEGPQALRGLRPDVLLVDVDGVTDPDPLRLLLGPLAARVLAVTSQDVSGLDWVLLAGAHGILRKDATPEAVLRAIRKVHGGELWVDRGAFCRLLDGTPPAKRAVTADPDHQKIATLTARERQAIQALANDVGAPGKVIAGRLSISEHTLRNHLTSIYDKLQVQNRVDLYAYATKHGLAQ